MKLLSKWTMQEHPIVLFVTEIKTETETESETETETKVVFQAECQQGFSCSITGENHVKHETKLIQLDIKLSIQY